MANHELTKSEFDFLLKYSACIWQQYGVGANSAGGPKETMADIQNRFWPILNWGGARVKVEELPSGHFVYERGDGEDATIIILCGGDPGSHSIRVASIRLLKKIGPVESSSEKAVMLKAQKVMYGIGIRNSKNELDLVRSSVNLETLLTGHSPSMGSIVFEMNGKGPHSPLYKCRKAGKWDKLGA